MSNTYRAKPDAVHAMYWDGSKESYQYISKWMGFNKFLLEEEEPRCDYWDTYEEAPPQEVQEALNGRSWSKTVRKLREMELDADQQDRAFSWHYRSIQFYAWGDDQEVDPGKWIVFRGSERDGTDEFPIPRGKIMTDEEFRAKYEPIYGGYGDADGS